MPLSLQHIINHHMDLILLHLFLINISMVSIILTTLEGGTIIRAWLLENPSHCVASDILDKAERGKIAAKIWMKNMKKTTARDFDGIKNKVFRYLRSLLKKKSGERTNMKVNETFFSVLPAPDDCREYLHLFNDPETGKVLYQFNDSSILRILFSDPPLITIYRNFISDLFCEYRILLSLLKIEPEAMQWPHSKKGFKGLFYYYYYWLPHDKSGTDS